MNILLNPVGSHGDVHPFIGIGRALVARGHIVTLISLDPFRPLAERNGFAFASFGTDADYQKFVSNPELWQPRKGLKVLFQNEDAGRMMREAYDQIQRLYQPGQTILVSATLGFAARTAHETLGIPLATVHLQPASLYSVERPAVYPMVRLNWAPRWFRRGFYRFADWLGDGWLGPQVNKFRTGIGRPPARRIIGKWIHSPQRVIGLFPDWFGSAPDWPSQMKQTGFVRYDQGEQPLDQTVDRFLNDGNPPIVFSFGSAMRTGRKYFEAAVETCQRLGRRGILLAEGGDQIPPNLPSTVAQFDYAPFGQVFPRSAVVVHHGGIGTTAQCLAAGVPQLVVPLAFDQPDNADRVVRIGVGRTIPSRRFTPKRASRVLAELLTDTSVVARCREVRELMTATDPLPETCRLIEELAGRDAKPADVVPGR